MKKVITCILLLFLALPLAVPSLPGELTSLAAGADGSTVAYATFGLRGASMRSA